MLTLRSCIFALQMEPKLSLFLNISTWVSGLITKLSLTHTENLTKKLRSNIVFLFRNKSCLRIENRRDCSNNASPCIGFWWCCLHAWGNLCFKTLGYSLPFCHTFYHRTILGLIVVCIKMWDRPLSLRRELHSLVFIYKAIWQKLPL